MQAPQTVIHSNHRGLSSLDSTNGVYTSAPGECIAGKGGFKVTAAVTKMRSPKMAEGGGG